jgi:hypothetical protein
MLFHLGGVNAGERYIPLPANSAVSAQNALELEGILDQIQSSMPNGGTIFNTLNGDANVDFFTKMQERGMTAEVYPVMSGLFLLSYSSSVHYGNRNFRDWSRQAARALCLVELLHD